MRSCLSLNSNRGTTLAELVMAMAIGSVVALGLAMAFIFAIMSLQRAVAKNNMQTDGALALDKISSLVRNSYYTQLPPFGGPRLPLVGIDHENWEGELTLVPMEVEWRQGDQSLWLNKNFRSDYNYRMIPSVEPRRNDNGRVRVAKCVFTGDVDTSDLYGKLASNHMQFGKKGAIRVEMTLENDYGDIMHWKGSFK